MLNENNLKFVICGIDRTGKGTLINNIQKRFGPFPVIHSEAPPKSISNPAEYQKEYFKQCFQLASNSDKIIFDRLHLGEYVYGPVYRKTDPNFIFELEKHYILTIRGILVLLYTEDFSIMQDDGKSLNYNARETEQKLFIEAFNKSNFKHKYMIRIDNGAGGYKNSDSIFSDLLCQLKISKGY